MKFQQHLRAFTVQALVAGAALSASFAQALTIQPYSAEALKKLQGGGQAVAVHFHADWCSTCKSQEKALQALQAQKALPQVTVLVAEYDKEKELRKAMKVPYQSVLVVFKGSTEVARNNGDTSADKLQASLAKAV